jgi:hypothetical protein
MAQPLAYQIVVQGRIDDRLADWFGGLQITPTASAVGASVTSLTGALPDQAALMGLLRKLYDRGYLLISVNCLDVREAHGD